jgi:uncharacterized membrane protein YebE (DUF533 family)
MTARAPAGTTASTVPGQRSRSTTRGHRISVRSGLPPSRLHTISKGFPQRGHDVWMPGGVTTRSWGAENAHSIGLSLKSASGIAPRRRRGRRAPDVMLVFLRRARVTPERLIGALLQGAVGGRKRKRSRGALRYLAGGRSSFLNAGTLLTAAGLAWGAYEAATRKSEGGTLGPAAGPVPPGGPPPPPLPGTAPAAALPAMPAEMLRLVRLTIAAARADGRLAEEERAAILEQARAVGAEAVVQQEIDTPRPLAEIVSGVADPNTREQLYVLAFAVVRADESVSGAERIFLAQLAHALGLDPATTGRLESEAAAGIDAAAGQEG